MPEKDENSELKNYLLGRTAPESERERIEERLMLDESYFERLKLAEEELIQQYADGELTPDERAAFENIFLVSAERRARVKFARVFSDYVNNRKNPLRAEAEKRKFFASPVPSRRRLFSAAPLSARRAAAAAVVVCALCVAVGYFYRLRSGNETASAMASLNRAYQTGRPLESRISGFDYAPFVKTRGGETPNGGIETELNRAERILLDEAAARQTAENLHALGRLYLSKRRFDEALAELQKARKLNAADAEILSDTGAAYLEKYKADGDAEKNSELLFTALENFDEAVKLDDKLTAALFNRAACLELANLPNQAALAWRKYLELDSASAWADEARRRLRALDARAAAEISADEQEQSFITAAASEDDDRAFEISARNRELVKEKYLPQKLAFSIAETAPGDGARRAEKLEALKRLARLEQERIGDYYAADLAKTYSDASPTQMELLGRAQAAMKKGYKLCLQADGFSEALDEFNAARNYFLRAGDALEAETTARYFVAYCLYNADRRREAREAFAQIDDYAERKNYKWFALMNFYWLLGSDESLGLKTFSDLQGDYEAALEKSEDMGDAYTTQKYLSALVIKSGFVKQEKKSFGYLRKLLEFSNRSNLSARQKFRNLDKVIETVAQNRFNALSKAVVLESVSIAEAMNDPAFSVGADINAGRVHARAGDFEEAERWFERAEQNAGTSAEPALRNSDLARLYLSWGHLEKSRNDFPKAVEYYDRSLAVSERINTPAQLYEIKKSRLLAYQAAGDDDAVEIGIPAVIELAEKYRSEIRDEQERHGFFDNEQSVFDAAVEHEIRRNRYDRAYDYAEASNSRSLLDLLQKGLSAPGENSSDNTSASVAPLKIAEIREKIPAEVEIVQYTVLENKVLIWILSKEKFVLVASSVESGDLKTKIDDYLQLIKDGDRSAQSTEAAKNLSRELYRLLVAPAAPYLSKDKEIYLIPNKFLFYLPFASLVAPSGKYLLEDFVLSYSTSANVFAAATENARGKATDRAERFLGVGNPAFDRRRLPELADLPESGDEAREAAAVYSQSKVFSGREATKINFLNAVQNYEVIHFAGHYVVEPDAPLASKIVLAKASEKREDDFLTNAELTNKKLPRAKLVVLSACRTGVEGYYNGEGLIGLSRTFLAAGAPLVVASGWNVDSAATRELMSKFHAYRRAGHLSSSRALRQSQIDMLRSTDDKFQAPYFWAGFALFGGYATF